jgi:hypothetical protein
MISIQLFVIGCVIVVVGVTFIALRSWQTIVEEDNWDSIDTQPKQRKPRSDKGKKRKAYNKSKASK